MWCIPGPLAFGVVPSWELAPFHGRLFIQIKALTAMMLNKQPLVVGAAVVAMLGLGCVPTSAGESLKAAVERASAACYEAVQGKIAWDYKGNKTWNLVNVRRLCAGSLHPLEPGRCFNQVMFGSVYRGDGTRWRWDTALELCRGTGDADATISCFQNRQRLMPHATLREAISGCWSRFQDYGGMTGVNPPALELELEDLDIDGELEDLTGEVDPS